MRLLRRCALSAVLALAALSAPATAQASATNCYGGGLIEPLNVLYGPCNTDQNGGTGSVVFNNGGLTAELKARTQRGAEQVASSWQSNGPVADGTTRICVKLSTTRLSRRGNGSVQQQLQLSYNGAVQQDLIWSVTSTGTANYCASVPAGSSNIWWSLVTLAGGYKPFSSVQVVETLIAVSIATEF